MDKQVIAVNQHLADMTILKDAIEKTHTTVSEITAGTASSADSARAEFEATSLANKEAHQKADRVHSQVNTLFAKTELTFAETEKKSLALREEIRVLSDGFASQVQEMCRTGNFKFDAKPAVVVAKHDKKEVSVWKLVDGVTKPDFCHWIDSIDIPLEAIHGFVYPDLVFERIKRMPAEVTPALLMKAIDEINIEHKRKLKVERILAEGGVPPAPVLPGADPWADGGFVGLVVPLNPIMLKLLLQSQLMLLLQ